jgi:hypothetical protein
MLFATFIPFDQSYPGAEPPTPSLCNNKTKLFFTRGMLLMVPKILLLVEQIRPTTTQIYNLRTPISVLLEAGTLEAVKGVRNTLNGQSAGIQA